MNDAYRQQVALLIRILPLVYQIKKFAVHGGTAINLFHKNMPRYSVDIDLTYIPLKNREESLNEIEKRLLELKQLIEKAIPKIKITPKLAVWKLQCVKDRATVKIEVNGTKRGILGEMEDKILCDRAKQEFNMTCMARIVPFSQLYGGKIAAALSRQHPRDLFDYKFMEVQSLEEIKDGLMLCLLGSDKPIIESLQPNSTNQREAMENQLEGMSDIPFSYDDFEDALKDLIEKVNAMLTSDDKRFLLSFEQGTPDWDKCCAGDLGQYPSVQWKLQNIQKLKEINPQKHKIGIEKLAKYFQS
ncbi:MAG: nucleotidyl transferase AbiEii/AbiGii toxin family protein [Prevotellaceae bacterium]|jgi:predicted nucleotidyltransferase component of viral defense system|nr:nucleotidyl transferase AbiEii/AbiGii toxin family protein [Prevotellaceae bacterium]